MRVLRLACSYGQVFVSKLSHASPVRLIHCMSVVCVHLMDFDALLPLRPGMLHRLHRGCRPSRVAFMATLGERGAASIVNHIDNHSPRLRHCLPIMLTLLALIMLLPVLIFTRAIHVSITSTSTLVDHGNPVSILTRAIHYIVQATLTSHGRT